MIRSVIDQLAKPDDFMILADGLDHPECVACGPDGSLWAGGEAGQIYRISDEGEISEFASTGGFILGLALDGDGVIYACDNDRKAVVRITTDGVATDWFRGLADDPIAVPNYPVFDAHGRLYVSDSGTFDGNDGRLWVIERDGTGRVLSEDLKAFPNGLALSPDGRWLYVAMSNLPGVARLPLRNGQQDGGVQTVIELPGTVPDGLAFDAFGGLWVALYAPDRLCRLDPDGTFVTVVEDPRRIVLASPTNLAFVGPNRDRFVVASLCRWHIAAARPAVPGRPLHYPTGLAG